MNFPALLRRSAPSTPWNELVSLQEEVNRLFASTLGSPQRAAGLFGSEYIPPVDILRDKDNIIIRTDLPGIRRDDIDISLTNSRLVIRGEKKEETRDEQSNSHRVERFFGTFERVIDLPVLVDGDRIRASFKDGVLEIRAPLREEAKPRQITVNVN